MKRLLFLLLLFVNLQVITKQGDFVICAGVDAVAQHMYREENDNCQTEDGLWYHVDTPVPTSGMCDFSECNAHKCPYCGTPNDSESQLEGHMYACPSRPTDRPWFCGKCSKSFDDFDECVEHFQSCKEGDMDRPSSDGGVNEGFISPINK